MYLYYTKHRTALSSLQILIPLINKSLTQYSAYDHELFVHSLNLLYPCYAINWACNLVKFRYSAGALPVCLEPPVTVRLCFCRRMVTVLSEILSVTPILVTLIVFYLILSSFKKSCKNLTNLDKILLSVLIQKWTIKGQIFLFRTWYCSESCSKI